MFDKERIEWLIGELLIQIDPNPDREGLADTPKRVAKAMEELYIGNFIKPENLITTFGDTKGYDEIVVLRNIEFFSTCEHHMLQFSGYGHVAYLPADRVIGVSKLARLLDCFSKRLTIQERICREVTDALMEHLKPRAAGCILVAKHSCMECRGVSKRDSELVTSSLTGVFRDPIAHHELMTLIGSM